MTSKHRPQNQRAQNRKPKEHDYRDTFKLLKDVDRTVRSIQEPGRQIDRAQSIDRKIDHWTSVQSTEPPTSVWHWWATWRIKRLMKVNPYERTAGDAAADAWFELWWDIKALAFGFGMGIVAVVIHIVWWTFMIFVALPILWDWFWRLPPGLK